VGLNKPQPQPTRPLREADVSVKPVEQAGWGLERFEDTAARAQEALDTQVLEQLRAELQPRLQAEVAALKAQAREKGYAEGFEAGRKEGYEAGYAQGKAAAEERMSAREAAWQAQAESLLRTLHNPLTDLDDALANVLADLVTRSVAAFVQSDPVLERAWLATSLKEVLQTLRQQDASIDIYVPHGERTSVDGLLAPHADFLTLHEDPELEPGHYRVVQGASEVHLNMMTALDNYIEQLRKQLVQHVKETSEVAER